MSRKHAYATKAQLERLVLRMQRTGILYSEAVEEFKRQFILAVLRDADWNQTKAARILGMHRNSLVRTLRKFHIDISALRTPARRAPRSIRVNEQHKIAC